MAKEKTMTRDMENLLEWRKKNIRRIIFDLNRTTEEDVINYLESLENKRQYLIDLVRKDMKKKKKSA